MLSKTFESSHPSVFCAEHWSFTLARESETTIGKERQGKKRAVRRSERTTTVKKSWQTLLHIVPSNYTVIGGPLFRVLTLGVMQ